MKIANQIVKIISTFFYVGYLPFIPGTFASLSGVFLFYLIKGRICAHIIFIIVLMTLGFLLTGKAEEIFKRKDANCIVIDEVTGMLLSFLFIPCEIRLVIVAFVIFRLLDTLKPYPAGLLQSLKGGLGIMGDDIVAGIYTNIILQTALRLLSFKTS